VLHRVTASWPVGCLDGWSVGRLVGCLVRRSVKVSHTEQEKRVGRRQYNVKFQNLPYLSITTLTQHPSLFAEDVDFHIDFDCDKVRRTANGKEYLIPKKFAFKMEPHGMTIQLENLFNGNKFLGK